jgi:hypothetical protein
VLAVSRAPLKKALDVMADTDWRLEVAQTYLEGETFVRRPYRRYSNDWDHDHCVFCTAKFMEEDGPDVLHVGYCTLVDYYWICDTCFRDFEKRFAWRVQPDGNAV